MTHNGRHMQILVARHRSASGCVSEEGYQEILAHFEKCKAAEAASLKHQTWPAGLKDGTPEWNAAANRYASAHLDALAVSECQNIAGGILSLVPDGNGRRISALARQMNGWDLTKPSVVRAGLALVDSLA